MHTRIPTPSVTKVFDYENGFLLILLTEIARMCATFLMAPTDFTMCKVRLLKGMRNLLLYLMGDMGLDFGYNYT